MLHDKDFNDISVTKFLQQNANVTQQMQNGQRMNIIQFLEDNDISVTKFLNYMQNSLDEQQQNILVTEFLETNYLQWAWLIDRLPLLDLNDDDSHWLKTPRATGQR